ncbi:hypothetical protein CISG_07889 [Coccidioides immitis RMSCC 3703]|uniref:Uncharacterized protein n=2 Tax=Coccidioides immitis TaxID=5501 RepID=A0A0J8R6T7_COCIT|nr:hypothetical protein CIRG_04294 [Coccidioides immitis RMSCC 2394]KMU79458.1 hypothetical protein CISG_07889 [Coccidioides immitis RMSCC 3703]
MLKCSGMVKLCNQLGCGCQTIPWNALKQISNGAKVEENIDMRVICQYVCTLFPCLKVKLWTHGCQGLKEQLRTGPSNVFRELFWHLVVQVSGEVVFLCVAQDKAKTHALLSACSSIARHRFEGHFIFKSRGTAGHFPY